ncbi:MAG: ABC transporter substrate-binding protein [Acidilobaceae archaeon]
MSYQRLLINAFLISVVVIFLIALPAYVLSPFFRDSMGTSESLEKTEALEKTEVEESQSESYVEIVDFAGRTVSVPRNITRIAAIGPGALRLVLYLGAIDLVVGVEEIEKTWTPGTPTGRDYLLAYYEILKGLPTIGPGGPGRPPNVELLVSVRPQVIVMSKLYMQFIDPDRLEQETGAKVIVIDYGEPGYLRLEDFKRAITILGKALGKEERALELIMYVERVVLDLRARTGAIEKRPSVYVGAASYRGPQPFTSSQGQFVPLVLLNTPSIVDELSRGGFVSVDFEFIIKKQPELVFIDENNLAIVLNDFKKDSRPYCSLFAFKENKVFGVLPYNHYHTNVATALANAYWMGKVLYPERFADVDPVVKANEIYSMFLGKPLYEEFVKNRLPGFTNLSDLFKCSS